MCKLLMSINPEHVANILAGKKKFEFRKTKCKEQIDSIVIYSTAPRKNNGGNKKGGRNNGRRDRREKPAPQVQKTRETKLVDDFGGTGLYGKIEL